MLRASRVGIQRPTFEHVGAYSSTDGHKAVELFNDERVAFFDSQEYELTLMLARDSYGDFAARTIAISKPRQNGKSFAARYYAAWMAAVEGKSVLYSAHHGPTTHKMFKALLDLFDDQENHPDFYASVENIYRAIGGEGIYLQNGGMIEFSTRTNSGGRGGTYDIIIIDEAQELTDDQMEALKPTTSASESGDPQTIYIGTPPGPKCSGTVFRDLHRKAHDGTLGNAWWLEWAVDADDVSKVDAGNVDTWYATNPALGLRIRESVVRDEYETMTPEGFARERLGWWGGRTAASPVISEAEWMKCGTGTPPKDGKLAYAVKFSPDGSTVSLSVALKPDDGAPHVELVEKRSTARGTAWLSQWLIERRDKPAVVVVDGLSGAQALCDRISGDYPKNALLRPRSGDVTAAASLMLESVREESVTWFDREGAQDELTRSVTTSTRRSIGSNGGWGFGGDDSTPVESAALALWGVESTKRDPRRKQTVW